MGTKAGQLRESLMDAIERVKSKRMDPQQAVAIAKLAGQISLSMQVEANIRLQGLEGEKLPLGQMQISTEPTSIEPTPASIVHRIKDDDGGETPRASSAFDFAKTL